MLDSILLLSVPVFYVICAYSFANKKTQILTIFCFLTITISSIRWESGTDWEFYHSLFLDPSSSYYAEQGYLYLSSLCSNLGISYNFFLAILALPWILLAYLPVAKLKLNYQASCVYFIALYSLSFLNFIGGRQQVAIALLFALMLVRSLFIKILIIITGLLFHSSFLLFLSILYSVYFSNSCLKYVIYRVKQFSLLKNTFLYFITSLALMLSVVAVFSFSLPTLTNLVTTFRTGYGDYLAAGALYIRDPASQLMRTVLKMSFYILPPLLFHLFGFRNKLNLVLPKNLPIFNFYASPQSWALLVIVSFLSLLTIINPNIGGRLELYIRPFLAVQVALFASLSLKSRTKFTWPTLLLLFGLYSKFIISLFADDWYLPYTTVFSS